MRRDSHSRPLMHTCIETGARPESAHASSRIPDRCGRGKPSGRAGAGSPCWFCHAGRWAPSPWRRTRTHPPRQRPFPPRRRGRWLLYRRCPRRAWSAGSAARWVPTMAQSAQHPETAPGQKPDSTPWISFPTLAINCCMAFLPGSTLWISSPNNVHLRRDAITVCGLPLCGAGCQPPRNLTSCSTSATSSLSPKQSPSQEPQLTATSIRDSDSP